MLAFFGSFILIIRGWAWFKSGRQTELLYTAKRGYYIFLGPNMVPHFGWSTVPAMLHMQPVCVCVCFPDTVAGTTHRSTLLP